MNSPFKFLNVNLRIQCFIIGYVNLIVTILDIVIHVVMVYILTGGFQCDVTEQSLSRVNWPWMERILFTVNLGTHGFGPFPIPLRKNDNLYQGYLPLMEHPKCYPGMFHVYLADVLNFIINLIWFQFIKSYVAALHKKQPEPMRMWVWLGFMKMVLQVMHFNDRLDLRIMNNLQPFWIIKIIDFSITAFCILVAYKYMKQLQNEKRLKSKTACSERLLEQQNVKGESIVINVVESANKCPNIVIDKEKLRLKDFN